MLSHRAVAWRNATRLAPLFVTGTREQHALVRDQILGRSTGSLDRSIQERLDRLRGRSSSRNAKAHGLTGEMVNDHGDPPAERSALRDAVRRPGRPEPGKNGNRGQINIPDMIRSVGDHDALRCGSRGIIAGWRISNLHLGSRRRDRFFFDDSPNRAGRRVEAGPAEDVGDLDLPESQTERLELLHDVEDEVRILVNRLGLGHQRLGSAFMQAPDSSKQSWPW